MNTGMTRETITGAGFNRNQLHRQRLAACVNVAPLLDRSPQCPKCLQSLEDSANFCPSCGEDVRGVNPTADTLSGPWTGRVIDGRYRLVEKLGEGGMGTVYKVEHVRMGKVLALKVLRPDLAIDKKLKARFHQEARVVSKLSHPNTIQVFDFGELDDGSLYIAMEFLAGRDLMWRLRTHGPFSEERAIAIGIQVLSSLAEAHELDIIHRDIKPANIMLLRRKDGTDTVKVLDFGIAKLNEGEGRKHITGVADFLGTPMYMSPEQGAGEELDARSDLYSVAAMLFELVTGRGVFEGPTAMSIVTQHMSTPPPRFAQVAPDRMISPTFEAVIRKALSKQREDRYASADEMRHALERVRREVVSSFADFTPVAELTTGEVASRQDFDRYERSLRARRVVVPLLTLALIAAAGFGAWWTLLKPEAGAVFTAEREPNDEPLRATPIPLNQPVQGMIGRPAADNASDHDVFVVELPEDGVATVELGGVPDMNLVLDAYQFTSSDSEAEASPAALTGLERILLVDDGRTGEGERVDGLRVRKGPLYLRIQEKAHRTEPQRPARETTQLAYSLNVRPMSGDLERVEHESANDRLETAPASPLSRSIRAWTGTAVPVDSETLERPPPAVDVFRVERQEGARVFAVVVPPQEGQLAVMDAQSVESWRNAVASSTRVVAPPAYQTVRRSAVTVVPLEEGERGHAVRVQPLWSKQARRVAPAGSQYYVAFAADRPDGFDGLVDLIQVLEANGLHAERRRVADAVKAALKGSPNRVQLDARLGGGVAEGTAP